MSLGFYSFSTSICLQTRAVLRSVAPILNKTSEEPFYARKTVVVSHFTQSGKQIEKHVLDSQKSRPSILTF